MSAKVSLLFPLWLILTASSYAVADSTHLVLAPNSSVSGQTQEEWSRRWWQWASSFPSETSPISDRTGERCGAGQSGPVWFLAGAFGSALVQRHCTVPKGKYLFFPLINYVVFPDRDSPLTCEQATENAKEMTDSPAVLVGEIDGIKIPDLVGYRQTTRGCFDLAARSDVRIAISRSAANGYYLMLYPMSPGHHSLRFGGELPTLRQAISYELLIK
jgi:hypothetical protein